MAYTNFYFLVLDIETSKKMEYDEQLNKDMPTQVWLSYGVCKLYDIKGKQISSLRFREWDELRAYFMKLKRGFKKKLMCFVHNLSYEFDFLIKNLERPKSFICNATHGVIASTLEEFNIEFRCTYQLSKMSLAKIGDLYNLPKLESDYRDIYPEDEVTEEEWVYCERDCDIIVPYILDELRTYKMFSNLPYTSTGKVRKKLREKLVGYEDNEWDLMPPENCFNVLNKTFRGAITMSNPRFTNRILNCRVKSFDEKSKYPGVMLTETFPYNIRKVDEFNNETYKQHKFWLARVVLHDIYSNFEWGVISSNSCEYVDHLTADIFNGKIINCKSVDLYITNVDLDLFRKVYYIKDVEFKEFYVCDRYDKLPSPFIELIKEFAENKTRIGKELKEVEKMYGEDSNEWTEKYKEYMDAKAMLNGIYGMMVQKLTPQEFYIDDKYLWHEKENQYKCVEGKHLYRNFLFGIYITAYSRYDLVTAIIANCPETFVYCDTDSIKFIYTGKEFNDTNKDIPEYLQQFDYLKGFNKFEEEPEYNKFLTYGAKKYCYEKNGHFGFTVSGLPKRTTINSFEEFTLGTIYENCKLAKRYIYCDKITDIDCWTNDIIYEGVTENIGDSRGGVALFEVNYELNMTQRDLIYIERNSKQWEIKNSLIGLHF